MNRGNSALVYHVSDEGIQDWTGEWGGYSSCDRSCPKVFSDVVASSDGGFAVAGGSSDWYFRRVYTSDTTFYDVEYYGHLFEVTKFFGNVQWERSFTLSDSISPYEEAAVAITAIPWVS